MTTRMHFHACRRRFLITLNSQLRLERNHVIRHVAGERRVEIREAADAHAFNSSGWLAIPGLSRGKAALECALIAQHQEHPLLFRNLRDSLTDRIARTEAIGV